MLSVDSEKELKMDYVDSSESDSIKVDKNQEEESIEKKDSLDFKKLATFTQDKKIKMHEPGMKKVDFIIIITDLRD